MKILSLIFISLFFCYVSSAQQFIKTPPPMKLTEPLPANLFVELGRIINPTVVNISTSSMAAQGQRYRDPLMDLFEQFYGLPMQPQQRPKNRPQQMSLGTGFIIREDGLIVTNNHVVQGADRINVQLSEKAEKVYEAKIVGSDQRSDIALIKIKPNTKLAVAALGNSKDLEVGEWVAAFGNPYGHGHTMTKGIISSKGREIEEINKIPLLQTDASINPGNSGGPLVDTRGYVIGVNSAIDARAQGIGFAIPIDEVKKIIPELESRGSIRKGYLGVQLGELDPNAAEYLGLGENRGAVIVSVEPGGPGARGGLKVYDIVTEFNGRKIRNSVDLVDAVGDSPIGQKAKVVVIRDTKSKTLEIPILERPSPSNRLAKSPLATPEVGGGQPARFDLGFSVSDMTDELRKNFGYANDVKKPIITKVNPNSLAALAGLSIGDLVLSVNKSDVTSAKEVLAKLQEKTNTFQLARGPQVIVVTLSK